MSLARYYGRVLMCSNFCGKSGLSMENFVPFLDYKERAQQWKWIGAGRDSNQHLAPLFYHWMKHKDAVCLDGLGAGQGSPSPVKM